MLTFLRMSEKYFWFRFKVMFLSLLGKSSEEDLKKIKETEDVTYFEFFNFKEFKRMMMKIWRFGIQQLTILSMPP